MSSVQTLRQFVNDRLAAAAREIFGVFEQTVSELEEEVNRQRKLLDGLLKPVGFLQNRDKQQLQVSPEEQQECSSQSGWETPEHLHTIEEEGEDETGMSFNIVHVKCEDDDAQSSQHLQTEGEPPISSRNQDMKTEADGDDYSGPDPCSNLDSDLQSDHQGSLSYESNTVNWVGTSKALFGSVSEKTDADKSLTCSGCGRRCYSKRGLSWHSKTCRETLNKRASSDARLSFETEEKLFECSDCGKLFNQRIHLKRHMVMHTGEKPFDCSQCGRSYSRKGDLKKHIRIHTGEKPFCCSHCGKCFNQSGNLTTHLRIHKREKPFTCPECGKCFSQRGHLKKHMSRHMGDKT
ncbi:zinc finger protein 226-like [Synchiropus splendidus]|uniref:zinc finger protein 226-like n=1 Tax=Synchiropus splendidus TaxID=270530 RepID=UPI00237E38D6|nr:zinc finger protein 226-like [Synchiropus splendidus]